MPARLIHLENGAYALSGELDFDSVAGLWHSAHALFAAQTPVSIDLADVSRSDSSGVALLVAWSKEARMQAWTLRFLNMPAQMQAITQVAELQDLLPIKNSD